MRDANEKRLLYEIASHRERNLRGSLFGCHLEKTTFLLYSRILKEQGLVRLLNEEIP